MQPKVQGHEDLWTCYGWTVLRAVSSCFVQTCHIDCSGYIPQHEGTALNCKGPETIALLDTAFCKHFKAGVLGAIMDFSLIFCDSECIMFKSYQSGHLSSKLNTPIKYGVGGQ